MKKLLIGLLFFIPIVIVLITLSTTTLISKIVAIPVDYLTLFYNGSEVSANRDNTVPVGEVGQISSIIMPSAAANKTVRYYSSDPSIATIEQSPSVLGGSVSIAFHKAGETVISAVSDDGGISAFSRFACYSDRTEMIGLYFSESDMEVIAESEGMPQLSVGDVYKLETRILPLESKERDVVYSSDKPSVISVDANGIVSALSEGRAIVTVRLRDGTLSQSLLITVSGEGVIFNTKRLTVTGDSLDLTPYLYNLDASISSTSESASVLNKTLTMTDYGDFIIKGVIGDHEQTLTVTRTESVGVAIANKQLAPTVLFTNGQPFELEATSGACDYSFTPENAVWSTSDSSVATVNNGRISALAEGSVTISVSDGTSSDSITFDVATALTRISLNYNDLTDKAHGIKGEWVVGSYIFKNGEYATNTVQLSATAALPTELTEKVGERIEWSSSDETLAVINESGIVTIIPVEDDALHEVVLTATAVTQMYDDMPVLASYTLKINNGIDITDTQGLRTVTSARKPVNIQNDIRIERAYGGGCIRIYANVHGNGYMLNGTELADYSSANWWLFNLNEDNLVIDNVWIRGLDFQGDVGDLNQFKEAGRLLNCAWREGNDRQENLQIKNCIIENGKSGIYMDNLTVTVSGCVLRNIYESAIYVRNGTTGCNGPVHVTIKNVVIYDCLLLPINLASATHFNEYTGQNILEFQGEYKVYNWRKLSDVPLDKIIADAGNDTILKGIVESNSAQLRETVLAQKDLIAYDDEGEAYYFLACSNYFISIDGEDLLAATYVYDLPENSPYEAREICIDLGAIRAGIKILTLPVANDYIVLGDSYSPADRDSIPDRSYD